VFTVLSVACDEIHPTINLSNPDPKCDLDYVPNVMRQKVVRAALSNSFGFGGQNATIVVRKYSGAK
jgi:3-oxoacyl-[acyl-carrier-protein] synthase II